MHAKKLNIIKRSMKNLLYKRSNNFFVNIADYVPSFPFEQQPSLMSYHIGECHFSKPFFSDIGLSNSTEETFKPCQTMEEKNECTPKS